MRIPLNSEPHKTNIIIQIEILKAPVSKAPDQHWLILADAGNFLFGTKH